MTSRTPQPDEAAIPFSRFTEPGSVNTIETTRVSAADEGGRRMAMQPFIDTPTKGFLF